jgi:hypothetical protein
MLMPTRKVVAVDDGSSDWNGAAVRVPKHYYLLRNRFSRPAGKSRLESEAERCYPMDGSDSELSGPDAMLRGSV